MKRRIVAIVLALIVALVGAGAVIAYASSADARAVAGQQVQMVYIAKAAVPEGTTVEQAAAAHLIAPEEVVAKGVPAGALKDLSQQKPSNVALSTIQPGSIVLSSAFGTPSRTQVKAAAVPKGKVAITVSLEDAERVAALLKPGADIVIYDTFSPEGSGSSDSSSDEASGSQETHVLLPKVEVIAVGSEVVANEAAPQPNTADGQEAAASEQPAASSALVTVAVTPEDAITLVHGIRTGTLYAGLLGTNVKIDRDGSVTAETLFGQ